MRQRAIGFLPDVALGYGTPQIQYILTSLGRHYGNRSPILVCEPDSPIYPETHRHFREFSFHRIYAKSQQHHNPWWYLDEGSGQEEFADRFVTWIQTHQPSILVVTSACLRFLTPEILQRARSPFVICYALEYQPKGNMSPATALAYAEGLKSVQVILFSEQRRQYFHNRDFQTQSIPQCHLYNACPKNSFPTKPPGLRNGRMLMQSISIMWGKTFPEYLLTAQRPNIPVDICGNAFGGQAALLRSRDISAAFNVRYLGNIPLEDLIEARASYSYSFVSWNPEGLSSLFVSPCKFYESIASGVPPISAPHPECVDVIRRYDCGILMRDWSFGAFCDALENALRIQGTARYRELVRNCRYAHRKELNWEAQFAKAIPFLPTDSSGRIRTQQQPKFIIAKPGLIDDKNSEWGASMNLLTAAAESGFHPVALVNRLLSKPLPDCVSAHPIFWHDSAGKDPASPKSGIDAWAGERFLQDLERALRRVRAGRGDHLWLDGLSMVYLRQLAVWLASKSTCNLGTWHVVPADDSLTVSEDIQLLAKLFRKLTRNGKLRLYSHSHTLARSLGNKLGIGVTSIGVPAGSEDFSKLILQHSQSDRPEHRRGAS